MELWKDSDVFKALVSVTSSELHIPEFAVEKDFYIMEVLRIIANNDPNIVFKGGTSLSKAYCVIQRFSEDLDLSVILPSGVAISTDDRDQYQQYLLAPVTQALESMHFSSPFKCNPNSSPLYYCVNQSLDSVLFSGGATINSQIKIESTLLSRPYPTEKKTVGSYIFSYLKKHALNDTISKYGLDEFSVQVQDIKRTAIDKMCAICDYYIERKSKRNSRHIYDLYEISNLVDYSNKAFLDLAKKVYAERTTMDRAYSATEGISMNDLYRAMIHNHFYQRDYEEITSKILFSENPPTYSDVISILTRIIDLKIFC